jgi:hypothetical protein
VAWVAIFSSDASVAIKNISFPFSYPFASGISTGILALANLNKEPGAACCTCAFTWFIVRTRGNVATIVNRIDAIMALLEFILSE